MSTKKKASNFSQLHKMTSHARHIVSKRDAQGGGKPSDAIVRNLGGGDLK
jgi:hypothetical protein